VAGATRGEVSIDIAGTPAHVYELVADVTRMGEWSPECRRCEWLDEQTFLGHNQAGPIKWSTTSRVVAADPGREFAFTVIIRDRESTRWRYRFEPIAEGTRVTESYEFVWAPLFFRIGDVLMRRDRQLRAAMQKTLERIKAAAEIKPE
jgi:hypothetical protein